MNLVASAISAFAEQTPKNIKFHACVIHASMSDKETLLFIMGYGAAHGGVWGGVT